MVPETAGHELKNIELVPYHSWLTSRNSGDRLVQRRAGVGARGCIRMRELQNCSRFPANPLEQDPES